MKRGDRGNRRTMGRSRAVAERVRDPLSSAGIETILLQAGHVDESPVNNSQAVDFRL